MLLKIFYIIMAVILGNNGYLAIGKTETLTISDTGGTWASSNTAVATIDAATGVLTGVAAGQTTISYKTATTPVNVIGATYSNGFDLARLLPVMMARKGWKQPTATDFSSKVTLNSVNTTCVSGQYFQNDHPANSPATLFLAQDDPGIGSDNFNQWLTDMNQTVVMDALNAVFREPAIIEEPKIVYEKAFRSSYVPITNSSKFCGFQMQVAQGDYSTKINSISITATAPCTVRIYLYNDLRQAPLWYKDVTVVTANDQTIVNIDDCILTRLDDSHKGGIFYFGYYQDQMAQQGAQGVDVYLNWWTDYNMLAVQAFEATSDYTAKTFVRDRYYSNYRTYGFGIEASTYYDFTNTIIRNAYAFDKLIGMFMTQKSIETIMLSSRTNGTKRQSEQQMEMLYDTLEGRTVTNKLSYGVASDYATGLRNRIELEVKRVQKTFFPDDQIMTTTPPVNGNAIQLPHWGNQI